jgi:hypothetical protein
MPTKKEKWGNNCQRGVQELKWKDQQSGMKREA